jgi:leucine-rich repeat protein SHOC2
MVRCAIALLLVMVSPLSAQWGESPLDSLKVYRSVEEALREPEKVYRLHLDAPAIDRLPREIAMLHNLQEISLAGQTGLAIDDALRTLSALPNLYYLDLSRSSLGSLPPGIGNLTTLRTLNLSHANLDKLPDEIGRLRNLESLDLSGNYLTTLPETIGELTGLEMLDLSISRLGALPDSIGALEALEHLDISNTSISALPASITRLKRLKRLAISTYQFDARQMERVIEMFPGIEILPGAIVCE